MQVEKDLLLEELKGAGYSPISERVQTAEELKDALSRHSWDVILSDYVMPQFSGPDALYADTLFPDSKVLLMAGLEKTLLDQGFHVSLGAGVAAATRAYKEASQPVPAGVEIRK